MKILTCIKQVPASANVEVDPKTGVLIRDGRNVKMNPYDLYALEVAFQIQALIPNAQVDTLTMGPPSAVQVLKEALYMGSDEGHLLSDYAFAGADVYATAYAISQLIERLGMFDLIVCGKQTTDGDTAQVGPEIAEFLNIPHIPYVINIESITEETIRLKSLYDTYEEIVEVRFPCLITVEKGLNTPRLPSYNRKKIKENHPIRTYTLNDLADKDALRYGLNGSPTQVESIFPPHKRTDSIVIEGTSDGLADRFFTLLKESKFL